MNAIKTKHNLDFLAAPWRLNPSITCFIVGTCHGQYSFTDNEIMIISIINERPGNGHLNDVFQWFEFAANNQNRNLKICEFMNDKFKKHCIEKRGFIPIGDNDVIKYFK